MILITIVGQDTEGFHRFIYTRHEYDYRANEEKTYLTIIIIASVIGAIIIIVLILCIVRKKKYL